MKTQKTISIHRFNDSIAIHSDDIETIYISKHLALKLQIELTKIIHDINQNVYVDSNASFTVLLEDKTD